MYELYGIMIHSGGAYGGHYSAYIKDFEKPSGWYHFNDTFVKKISVTEIVDVFGANPKAKKFSSAQNAYMLMYRLVTDTNPSITLEDIPDGL